VIVRRIVRWTLSGLSMGLAVVCLVAFHDRYWRWRDCFNELGRCYDPISQDVYLEQAGIVWGGLAGVFVLAGLLIMSRR
jgi:hypothetical protein